VVARLRLTLVIVELHPQVLQIDKLLVKETRPVAGVALDPFRHLMEGLQKVDNLMDLLPLLPLQGVTIFLWRVALPARSDSSQGDEKRQSDAVGYSAQPPQPAQKAAAIAGSSSSNATEYWLERGSCGGSYLSVGKTYCGRQFEKDGEIYCGQNDDSKVKRSTKDSNGDDKVKILPCLLLS
jgi:hypothetical protein